MSLSINKNKRLLVNSLVVLLFFFGNPFYALFFCGFLNLTSLKINYWIFSFMFVFSFSLFYYLKDYSYIPNLSDIGSNIERFNKISDLSWSGIFFQFINSPAGNEPFFWLYVKLVNILLFNSASLFVLFHYLITFVLIAYLGKIVSANKFVLIILCILFTNFAVITNVFEVWRHTMANFIFMIGIFSFEASVKNWWPRILIYSSALFHIATFPLIIFYEIFTLFTKRIRKYEFIRLYSKEVIGYTAFVLLGFIIIIKYGLVFSEIINLYNRALIYFSTFNTYSYQILFNTFSFMIFMFLWIRKNKLTKFDIFIATQYFIISIVVIALSVPDIFGRYLFFIMFGGAILIGKMVVTNLRFGFIILTIIFIYDIYTITYKPELFSFYFFSEFNNPVYGLGAMIYNYDILLNFNF